MLNVDVPFVTWLLLSLTFELGEFESELADWSLTSSMFDGLSAYMTDVMSFSFRRILR